MKVGIKYCGGCNPYIDQIALTKQLKEKLESDTCTLEYFDFHGCEVVLVLNGCSVGCAEVPENMPAIIVSGFEIDGQKYLPEALFSEVIGRVMADIQVRPGSF